MTMSVSCSLTSLSRSCTRVNKGDYWNHVTVCCSQRLSGFILPEYINTVPQVGAFWRIRMLNINKSKGFRCFSCIAFAKARAVSPSAPIHSSSLFIFLFKLLFHCMQKWLSSNTRCHCLHYTGETLPASLRCKNNIDKKEERGLTFKTLCGWSGYHLRARRWTTSTSLREL